MTGPVPWKRQAEQQPEAKPIDVDRSDAADARRFRWLLDGNGYFMEEEMLCGHPPTSTEKQDDARRRIDEYSLTPEPKIAATPAAAYEEIPAPCTVCKGRGMYGFFRCQKCHGTGLHHPVDPPPKPKPYPGVAHDA